MQVPGQERDALRCRVAANGNQRHAAASSQSCLVSASVGLSAITRTTGSVLLGRTWTHRSAQSSRSPSWRFTFASGQRFAMASRAADSFSFGTVYLVLSIAYAGSDATNSESVRP